jgi:hypothetical protein
MHLRPGTRCGWVSPDENLTAAQGAILMMVDVGVVSIPNQSMAIAVAHHVLHYQALNSDESVELVSVGLLFSLNLQTSKRI